MRRSMAGRTEAVDDHSSPTPRIERRRRHVERRALYSRGHCRIDLKYRKAVAFTRDRAVGFHRRSR
jgi:hypothetical protein